MSERDYTDEAVLAEEVGYAEASDNCGEKGPWGTIYGMAAAIRTLKAEREELQRQADCEHKHRSYQPGSPSENDVDVCDSCGHSRPYDRRSE